jgi:hypothetical protein
MRAGVVLVSLAGFGRDKALQKTQQCTRGGFLTGLIMVVVSAVLSVGLSFSFVYSQGPIVAGMKAQGAGEIAANFAVWSVGLLGGALVNLAYPAYLMTKNRSWRVLRESWQEAVLATDDGCHDQHDDRPAGQRHAVFWNSAGLADAA